MYGFGGVGLWEMQLSISELSVVGGGGWWVGGGLDKRTSWSDLHRVRQKDKIFSYVLYCVLTWRKSSQSHWKARDIMFSLIVNLDFDRIQKKSHITSKQAFEKLRVPTHGQSKLN